MLQSDPAMEAFEFTEIKTDFEFLMNSNSYLRVNWKKKIEDGSGFSGERTRLGSVGLYMEPSDGVEAAPWLNVL